MNKIDYFETSYDRSIYDLEQLRLELTKELHKLKNTAEKHKDIYITYKDKNGDVWEARSWQDIQDSYACDSISMKKFERLAEQLEKKQTYYQQPIMIYQIEQEIKMLENIISDIAESKEKRWPLV